MLFMDNAELRQRGAKSRRVPHGRDWTLKPFSIELFSQSWEVRVEFLFTGQINSTWMLRF